MECNGCHGKGWVETAGGLLVHICPICKGTGWVVVTYSTETNKQPEEMKHENSKVFPV